MRTGTPVLTREFGMVAWKTRSSDSNSSAIRRAVFSPPSLATIKCAVRISTQGSIFSFFSFSGFVFSLSLSRAARGGAEECREEKQGRQDGLCPNGMYEVSRSCCLATS